MWPVRIDCTTMAKYGLSRVFNRLRCFGSNSLLHKAGDTVGHRERKKGVGRVSGRNLDT